LSADAPSFRNSWIGMRRAARLSSSSAHAAGSLPNIGNLTITPDLLSGALAGLFREPAGGTVPGAPARAAAGTAGVAGK
jgi:hypothetical protein